MAKLPSFLPGNSSNSSASLPAVNGGVAIVTGASSGIGRATVAALAQLKASTHTGTHTGAHSGAHSYAPDRIIGTSRNPDTITDPVDGVDYLPLDLANPASIDEFAASALRFGPPTVLVNNAGESQSGPLEELPDDALHRLFEINVLGQVGVTKKILPEMRQRGAGRIVMVGSMLGSFPLAYRSSYVASKPQSRASHSPPGARYGRTGWASPSSNPDPSTPDCPPGAQNTSTWTAPMARSSPPC